jgi:hypothetical protein
MKKTDEHGRYQMRRQDGRWVIGEERKGVQI